LILGQPQGTGGLNETSKPSFMVSRSNVPVDIARSPPSKDQLPAGFYVRDDRYANHPLTEGKIFLRKPLQTLVLQFNMQHLPWTGSHIQDTCNNSNQDLCCWPTPCL